MIADRESLLRRLHELRTEHRDLDTVIARLDSGPVDQLQLQRLKKRKLALRDEIAVLESHLHGRSRKVGSHAPAIHGAAGCRQQ